MKKIVLQFAIAVLCGISPCAHAQRMNEDKPLMAACSSQDGQMGQAGTYDCFEKVRRREDAALNRDYQRIITLFQRSDQPRLNDRDALRQAERAWLVYRDQFCHAEYGLYDGGTAGPLKHVACLAALTRRHHEELLAGYGWLLTKFEVP